MNLLAIVQRQPIQIKVLNSIATEMHRRFAHVKQL